MKRVLILLFAIAGLSLGSCSNCTTCDCTGDVEEICQSDFDSKTQYDAVVDLLESLDCECS